MAAALGLDLVFDVAAGGSGLDEGADGAGEVEGAAEAGVGVDEEGEGADVGDAADVGEDVVDGGDAEVGDAEGAGGDASAGEVDGAVAGALGHARVVGVDGAEDLQRVLGGDGGAKFAPGVIVPPEGVAGGVCSCFAIPRAKKNQGDRMCSRLAVIAVTFGLSSSGGATDESQISGGGVARLPVSWC